MTTALLLLSLPALAAAIVFAIIFAVKKLKKQKSKAGKIALCLLILSIALFVASIGTDDITSLCSIGILFFAAAATVMLIITLIRKLLKKKIKKNLIVAAVTVGLCIAMYAGYSASWNRAIGNPENYEVKVKTEYDFEVKDGDEPIEIITNTGFSSSASSITKYHGVYDTADNGLALEKTNMTGKDCLEALKENTALNERFQAYFSDFIERITRKYPDADLSVLYNNLKTLKVVELDKRAYFGKSLSVDSYGCYKTDENTIYIPEGTEYTEGEWGFQVLIHEFCHAVRISRWEENDGKEIYWYHFNSRNNDGIILDEAMNSVFSCSLLNYEERDIAYQLPSNYLLVMLDCLDNYTLSDYINHSDLYFLKMLDEATGYTNYAEVIWKLIALQRNDGLEDNINLSADKYYPIYSYLCDMYYSKYITPDMSGEQQTAVVDELVDKVSFDLSGEYKIDKNYFYTYLDEYLTKNSLSVS